MYNTARALPPAPSFCALVQAFFTEYLIAQRALSPRTVASYRDAFMLFVPGTHGQTPARCDSGLTENYPAFLDRGADGTASVAWRGCALRAFLKFASHRDLPLHSIEQALGSMKASSHPCSGFCA
jgi:site-specific recombinase XerD